MDKQTFITNYLAGMYKDNPAALSIAMKSAGVSEQDLARMAKTPY